MNRNRSQGALHIFSLKDFGLEGPLILDPLFFLSLGLQMPSKKVLWGVFRGLNTFLEGIWSPRVWIDFVFGYWNSLHKS